MMMYQGVGYSLPANASITVPSDTMLLQHIRMQAKKHFSRVKGSHDWDHSLRVHRLSQRIGAEEGADPLVTQAAAFLHDIGRAYQDRKGGQVCHAEMGAEMAGVMLSGYPLSGSRKENILHCIASHRFRKGESPRTVEARVLFDADKLDAIGAIGVARAFLFAGEVGARLHSPEVDVTREPAYGINDTGYREYRMKLTKIKDRMHTATGRRIAEERHRFMTSFFDRFLEEYQGER